MAATWSKHNSTYIPTCCLTCFIQWSLEFFACTGLLIKCRVDPCYGSVRPSCTVILTSASLVGTCDATDTIDEKLRIEVFLPPNQRVSGTLVAYDSYYNLAIVRAECLRVICPEDVLLVDTPPDQSRDRQLRKMCRGEPVLKNVVAIGREPDQGLLCGSMGVVSKEPITHGCQEFRLFTCKIKKAGIGGPLINFDDGSFAGMNFYDGRAHSTPFLTKRYGNWSPRHQEEISTPFRDWILQMMGRTTATDGQCPRQDGTIVYLKWIGLILYSS